MGHTRPFIEGFFILTRNSEMKIECRVFHLKDYVNLEKEKVNDIGIYGLFRFTCSGKEYGFYEDDSGVDQHLRGNEYSIPTWLQLFLEAVIMLKTNNYCAIKDIERMGIWVEFKKKKDELINISIIEDKSRLSGPLLITEPLSNAVVSEWKDAETSLVQLVQEISRITNEYLKQILTINNLFDETAETSEIKKLLREVKKLYGF